MNATYMTSLELSKMNGSDVYIWSVEDTVALGLSVCAKLRSYYIMGGIPVEKGLANHS